MSSTKCVNETWVLTPNGWRMIKVDDIDLAHRKRWIDGKLEGRRNSLT